jgi:hypothetical protein
MVLHQPEELVLDDPFAVLRILALPVHDGAHGMLRIGRSDECRYSNLLLWFCL